MKTDLARSTAGTTFRALLQEELARRCSKNAQYSLRAFAAQLDLDHSTLSQILRGKRALTPRTIEKIGAKVGLSADAVAAHAEREVRMPAADRRVLQEVQELTRDTLRLIADGHHYAILELTRLEVFKPDTRWIARVLGLTPDEVNLAVTRLVHLGLLEMVDSRRWLDTSGYTMASFEDFSRVAIERLSERVKGLTVRSAAGRPSEHSSTTIAVDTSRVPEAIRRLARFRDELTTLLESDPKRDDVYQLEIHFFPMTTRDPKKEDNPPWDDR